MIGNKTGNLGENIAERFLKQKGYTILHKNFWKPYGEIDIICEKHGVTHFMEVKSVSVVLDDVSCSSVSSCEVNRSDESIRPEDNLHTSKLRKLANVIQAYISTFHVKNWQFDIAIVYIDKEAKKARVKMIENQILEGRE